MEIESSERRNSGSNSRDLSSYSITKCMNLNAYKNKFQKFFVDRDKGQKMTPHDAAWILNTFARMRCDKLHYELTDCEIIDKVAEWCCTGKQTVRKLIQYEGFYYDNRNWMNGSTKVPIAMKAIVKKEIDICLKNGIPCTSKYLRDIFNENEIYCCRRTIQRVLKDWGGEFGRLRARENRKERDYVLEKLRNYGNRIKENDLLPFECTLHKKNCKCSLRKDVIYLDESYIHQNHVNKFGYFFPDSSEHLVKPSGKGPRVILAAALTVEGWLGIEPHNINSISKSLGIPRKDGTHSIGSIKYWTATSSKKDYHTNFNQEVFVKYFEENILSNLTAPSLIVMDNAPYHHYYDKDAFIPRKAKKKELKEWLEANGIIFDEKALKGELIELAEAECPPPVNLLEEMAERYGKREFGIPHEILYLPQYHPEINAIELAWAQVKSAASYRPVYNLNRLKTEVLPNCFEVITSERAKNLFDHVEKQEEILLAKLNDYPVNDQDDIEKTGEDDETDYDSDEDYIDL